MKRLSRKQIIWIAAGVLLLVALIYGFMPDPVTVQTATIDRAPLRVTVEEEGETRVMDHFVVTSPVAAFMRRVEVEPGDPVQAGQVLVQLEPPRATDLDARTRREASARVDAARAAVASATEQVRAAEATAARAAEERDRLRRLLDLEAATRQAVERAETEATQAQAAADAGRAALDAARADLASTQAMLAPAGGQAGVMQTVTAPSGGRVLAVHRRDAGHVNPGEPILEVGDTRHMEVIVELLSQDAVRVAHGTRVLLDQWGGQDVLEGVVQRIEPRAFTRVSALGVEEQRVPIVISLEGAPSDSEFPEAAVGLGSGYRVLAHFLLWEGTDVLQVPTGALFRIGREWAVFAVEGGRAVERRVEIGQRSGLAAQVIGGLSEGDVVIVHPDDRVDGGVRVRSR